MDEVDEVEESPASRQNSGGISVFGSLDAEETGDGHRHEQGEDADAEDEDEEENGETGRRDVQSRSEERAGVRGEGRPVRRGSKGHLQVWKKTKDRGRDRERDSPFVRLAPFPSLSVCLCLSVSLSLLVCSFFVFFSVCLLSLFLLASAHKL